MLDMHWRDDGVFEVRLAHPPVNALGPKLIPALDQALREHAGRARAIVLSGQPGMFSAGLDVPALLALDRAAIATLWQDFIGLMRTIAASPVPIVCAITGHSPAGGAVLAIFCDYRVMARGRFTIGLNEVAVGLPVPPIVVDGYTRLVGPARAERLLAVAGMLTADEALAAGLVDEAVEPDEVIPRAMARAQQLAAMPPVALRDTRRFCREGLMERFDALDAALPARMAEVWFSEETQASMRALVAKLAEKKR